MAVAVVEGANNERHASAAARMLASCTWHPYPAYAMRHLKLAFPGAGGPLTFAEYLDRNLMRGTLVREVM